MKIKTLLLFIALILNSFNAHGWGSKGHRIITAIAEARLDQASKDAIKELLGDETFVSISTWADGMKSNPDYKYASVYHYVNIPDDKTYEKLLESEKNPKGDVVWAILHYEDVLKNKKALPKERTEALKFLVHFIEDVHQPLHTGRKDDKGGNTIKLMWDNSEQNLHQIWDSSLIESRGYSYTEYVDNEITPLSTSLEKDFGTWENEGVYTWVTESTDLCKEIYDKLPSYCSTKDGSTTPVLNKYKYITDDIGTVDKRLIQAGIHLAAELNRVFQKPPLEHK